MEQTPHVAILPSPGLGHLIPLSELASRLVYCRNFLVTLIIPTTTSPPHKAQKPVLETLSNGVNCIFLPPISFEDLPMDTKSETKIILTMTRSLTSIRATIKSLSEKTRLVSLIVDPFGTDAFDIAKEFNVPPYLFFPSNAMNLSFGFYFPKLDGMVVGEFRDLVDPVLIPGCVPVHGRDLVDAVQDRTNVAYKLFSQLLKRFNLAEGILLNSFMELEEGAIKALQVEELGRPPVYPIGPLVKTGSGEERSECVDWLDNQPSGSVLFISFGSGGTLSSDQMNELAFGLEMSGQRFIWVAKRPNNKISNGTYFSDESENNSLEFLPKGFLDRTKGIGLVVPDWVPQVEILVHSSIGCFVTHCGWNSILESIAHGVPMIAWPLYAEQRTNAVLLIDDLRVALRVTSDDNGLVRREAIEKVVKEIMEKEKGNAIRNKIKVLKDASTKVLGEDGSSTKSLSNLVIKWKIKRRID